MRRSFLITSSTITAGFVIVLASSCGHTKKTLDAFEEAKLAASTDPGASGGAGGAGGESGGPIPAFEYSCDSVENQQLDDGSMKTYYVPPGVASEVKSVLSLMTPAQKANQMMGVDTRDYRDIERSPDVDVPGVGTIRGYKYRDAGRGVNMDAGQNDRADDGNNFATAFPVPSLRAASWDVDLERRIGAAIGDETAASKNNMNLGPCMNIVRHPYWGRTQETYGEDMYSIGRMATAYTVGTQEYVVACAKHWAANNVELKRAAQNAVMDEQTLREVYGRHFEMVVQDGAIGCIMASYNKINDVKATQNEHVLRTILKGPVSEGGFGFQGVVLTDWWAMPGDQNARDPATAEAETIEAVNAGLDIEVPWTLHYSESTLAKADQTYVEDAARRVLTQKYLFNTALESDPWSKKPPISTLTAGSITANPVHEALAEEAAVKSAVLLANGEAGSPVLPLTDTTSIAVVGVDQPFSQILSSVPKSCGSTDPDIPQGAPPGVRSCTFRFATDPALGDRGSSRVNADPERSVGPYRGIKEIAGDSIDVTPGSTVADAADAETVVVIVGYTPGDEGEEYYIAEGGDRASLNLPPGHNELVQQVLDLDKPTVIIIQSGSIVNLPWLDHSNKNQATIWAGYPGQRGGLALGKLIFGEENFGGKMPMAWPMEDELPTFKESEFETKMGYFFGYREFDRRQYVDGEDVEMVFPFGHGISYSTFEYGNLSLPCETTGAEEEAVFKVTVDITNTSDVDGDEVVMLFVKPPPTPSGIEGERPWKELKSFTRVSVPAGLTVTAELPVRVRDLRRWEGDDDGRWVVDSGDYTILVGKDAADAETTTNKGVITVNGN
jgi:beta-glucosidase